MKVVKVKKMIIRNFQGIENLVVNFNQNTIISGGNAKKKSTIMDAYYWWMNGKNQFFREIGEAAKPLDANSQRVHNLETKVEVILDVDGMEVKLEKTLTEKYAKSGKMTNNFTYSKDTIDIGIKKFKEEISGIFGDPETAKILTSATYFNEELDEDKKRDFMLSVVGSGNLGEIALKEKYLPVAGRIAEFGIDTIEADFKKKKSASEKLKTEKTGALKFAEKNLVEAVKPEETIVKKAEIEEAIKGLKEVRTINVKENTDLISTLSKDLVKSENALTQLDQCNKSILESKIDNCKGFVRQYETIILKRNKDLADADKATSEIDKKIKDIEEEGKKGALIWLKVKAEEFSEEIHGENCSSCNHKLTKEQSKVAYEANKSKLLKGIEGNISVLKKQKAELQDSIPDKKEIQDRITKGHKMIAETKLGIEIHAIYMKKMNEEITLLKELVSSNKIDLKKAQEKKVENFQEEIQGLEVELFQLNTIVNDYETFQKSKKQIDQLRSEKKEISQNILDYERDIALISALKLEHIESSEKPINDLLGDKMKVKLFHEQQNGNIKNTFDILIKNDVGILVPYQEANTGAKANCGLKIVDIISNKIELLLPIWIDNTESIETIQEVKSQTICLEMKKNENLTIC